MEFQFLLDFANNSYFKIEPSSTASSSEYFTSESSMYFETRINGFMVTDQPTIDVKRSSWILDSVSARIDTGSYTTFVPANYYDHIME